MNWELAACVGNDPELFFALSSETERAAKAVCAECPIRSACLAWASAAGVTGVWGGTTEDERRALRRVAA